MKIIFFCPSVSVINGGIQHIFRMAETLIELGYDAAVFEQSGQRPQWFTSSAPIVGQGTFAANADHIYVLPEDQPHILADFAKLPQRKLMYVQNHFYAPLGIGSAKDYDDFDISGILCSSRTIYDHCRLRHPNQAAYVIPCAIDQAQFSSNFLKKNVVAYMPRKRAIEATYIRDMFRFSFPQFRAWEWIELSGLPTADVARLLGEAKIFLSLSRLEGFGLAPLEAMASGCVVAGFTGIGGREYATPDNGFWANEDDFPECLVALKKAAEVCEAEGADYVRRLEAGRMTVQAYSPETFREALKSAWTSLLTDTT